MSELTCKPIGIIHSPFKDQKILQYSQRPVRLKGIENNTLHIQDVDVVDGTPLIDIKPYVPKFDCRKTDKIGWFTGNITKLAITKDDGRFCK